MSRATAHQVQASCGSCPTHRPHHGDTRPTSARCSQMWVQDSPTRRRKVRCPTSARSSQMWVQDLQLANAKFGAPHLRGVRRCGLRGSSTRQFKVCYPTPRAALFGADVGRILIQGKSITGHELPQPAPSTVPPASRRLLRFELTPDTTGSPGPC